MFNGYVKLREGSWFRGGTTLQVYKLRYAAKSRWNFLYFNGLMTLGSMKWFCSPWWVAILRCTLSRENRRYMCVSHVYLKRYVQYGMWYVHLCPWLRITCLFFSRKKQALHGITLYPGNGSSWFGDDSNGLVSSWPCWEPQAHPQTYPKWCVQSHPANIRYPYNGPQNKIVLLKLSEVPNNDLNATYHNHAPLGLNMLG